jgi:tetratricopeptide (TPR) repeat protein
MPAAVSLLGRGAELLHERDERRAELLVDLADALRETGDHARAEAVLEEVFARAADSGNRGLEARAVVVRLRIQVVSADAKLETERLRAEASRAIDVLEELGDERGLAKAWELLAWAPWFACRVAEAEAALHRSIEYARRVRDSRTEAQSLNLLVGAAFFGPLPVVDGVALCEEILAAFAGQQRVTASALRALAGLRAMEGRFPEARAALRRAKAILDDLGLAVTAASMAETHAIVELMADNAAAAEDVLRRGIEVYERMGGIRLASNLAALLAQALLAQDRADETLHYVDVAERTPAGDDRYAQVQWRTLRARVLPALGRIDEAEALAREAVELLDGTDVLVVRADALMDLAAVVTAAGRESEAVPLVEEARRLYERKGHLVGADRARETASRLG